MYILALSSEYLKGNIKCSGVADDRSSLKLHHRRSIPDAVADGGTRQCGGSGCPAVAKAHRLPAIKRSLPRLRLAGSLKTTCLSEVQLDPSDDVLTLSQHLTTVLSTFHSLHCHLGHPVASPFCIVTPTLVGGRYNISPSDRTAWIGILNFYFESSR
eukprot:109721-Hanusia_phi.AAC.5